MVRDALAMVYLRDGSAGGDYGKSLAKRLKIYIFIYILIRYKFIWVGLKPDLRR